MRTGFRRRKRCQGVMYDEGGASCGLGWASVHLLGSRGQWETEGRGHTGDRNTLGTRLESEGSPWTQTKTFCKHSI